MCLGVFTFDSIYVVTSLAYSILVTRILISEKFLGQIESSLGLPQSSSGTFMILLLLLVIPQLSGTLFNSLRTCFFYLLFISVGLPHLILELLNILFEYNILLFKSDCNIFFLVLNPHFESTWVLSGITSDCIRNHS